MLRAEFANRSFSPVDFPSNLNLTVEPYSARSTGGSDKAKLTVQGNQTVLWRLIEWLRYDVTIHNENNTPCWNGYIDSIEITVGALTLSIGLTDMFNRIAIKYNYQRAGIEYPGYLSWLQDNFSVNTYGYKEQVRSAPDMPTASAQALQATVLGMLGRPVSAPPSIIDGSENDGGELATATLYCKGYIYTLGWRYYDQLAGRIVATASNDNNVLGWGFSGTLGFTHGDHRIHSIDAYWKGLPAGSRVQISGLGANNGAFTVATATSEDSVSYTANTIYFDPSDDIQDTAGGLGFIRAHEMIRVLGSAGNSGYHRIATVSNTHVTTDTAWGAAVVHEGTGPSITIVQGDSIEVSEAVSNAAPGSMATVIAHGVKIAQKFTLPTAGSWTPGEILVKLKRVGAASDNVKVSIQTDSGGSPSGTILDSALVAGSDIDEDSNWIAFDLSLTATLAYGTNYWLVVERTGASSNINYYVVDMDTDTTYGPGTLKVHTGAAWTTRATDANLAFQVWGHRETTAQMADIVSTAGQFGLTLVVSNNSSLYERQYRDGSYTANKEFSDLLERGTSAGKRLIASFWPGTRRLQVYTEPVASEGNDLILRGDGRYYWPSGAPLEPGVIPVGRWITLADVPVEVNAVAKVSPTFFEAAEYDPKAGKVRPTETRGSKSIWSIGSTSQG